MTYEEIIHYRDQGVIIANADLYGDSNSRYWVNLTQNVHPVFRKYLYIYSNPDNAFNQINAMDEILFSALVFVGTFADRNMRAKNPINYQSKEDTPEESSKIEKMPKRTLKEDKYKLDLALELNTMEIYFSEALRAYLNLETGSRIGLACNRDTEQYYLYVETEADSGYVITDKGTIVAPLDITELKNNYGVNVLYIEPKIVRDAEQPAYSFYKLTGNKPYEAQLSPKEFKVNPKVKAVAAEPKQAKPLVRRRGKLKESPVLSKLGYFEVSDTHEYKWVALENPLNGIISTGSTTTVTHPVQEEEIGGEPNGLDRLQAEPPQF